MIVLDRFWGRSWSLLGGQNRPKMGQVGLKTALETIFFEKSECSRNLIKTNGFSTFLTPRSIPKRPKIVLRRPQDGLEEVFFSHRFLSSILIRFGVDFGSLWASFWEPKSVIFGIVFLMIFACRSEIAPRAAKSCQERPKSSPRPPKSGQRAPKRRPRAPKSGRERPKSGRK